MRVISWFSCGAASAVATKLAISESKSPVEVVYCHVREEHPDNMRFKDDCEEWFGQEIKVIRNEKYNGSIYEVFEKTKYLVGIAGAPCTRLLKKEMRKEYERLNDRQVFGYTVEEQDRVDRFIDANADVDLWSILIEKGLTKQDCLAILQRANIELPAMYKLGYQNNNCIGCVKGGQVIGTRFAWTFLSSLSAWQTWKRRLAQRFSRLVMSVFGYQTYQKTPETIRKSRPLSAVFSATWPRNL